MERNEEEEIVNLHMMDDGNKRATAFAFIHQKIKLFSYGKICPYVAMAKKVRFCPLYELCPFQFKALLTVADVEYNFNIS